MSGSKRHIVLVCAAVLAVVGSACGRPDRSAVSGDHGERLDTGAAYARTLVERGRRDGAVDAATALGLGYLERLRLGLGSPFRLIDYALHDPRLSDRDRRHLAWALLDRTLDGRAYRIDPTALDRAKSIWRRTRPGVGRRHLALIEAEIREADDPRAGELAVRLGYALAAVERSVDRRAFRLAVQAAALIRDRELARADARKLLEAADTGGVDPLRLLTRWRGERRFRVERPALEAIPADVERAAGRRGPGIATAVRELGIGSPVRAVASAPAARADTQPLLSPAAAHTLAVLSDSLDAPPQTPVVVGVDVHRSELLEAASGSEERAAGRRFVERATNEERFAAEWALIAAARGPSVSGAAARTALWTAVAMRTYAQEPVWFPGFGGPSVRDLERRFGLRSVEFSDDVPGAWHPYFRGMLAGALDDLVRVLPSVDLTGLGIRFGESRRRPSSLALHDPARRRIYLPPATSAGTIAHEIAHDLDWQIALREYRVRGDYGTDRATRARHGRLASAIARLASAPLEPPEPGSDETPKHPHRPAEVFARNVDWFVTAALAERGRSNGYLSSVQDDVLTGYGTVRPPDVTGESGAALVDILDGAAPVYATTRKAFLKRYGPDRTMRSYGLVRRVTEDTRSVHAPPARAAAVRLDAVERARSAALASVDRWACGVQGTGYDRRLEAGRRRLVENAAGARARGVAIGLGGELAGGDGRRWAAHLLYGTPAPERTLDHATLAVLREFVDRARRMGDARSRRQAPGFALDALPGRCATKPLIAAD